MYKRVKAIMDVMSEMISYRDDVTGGHLVRTRRYMELLIKRMAEDRLYSAVTDGWDVDVVLDSVPLHDVGKIAISDTILNKPARLTPEEFEVMKTHAALGAEIIDRVEISAEEKRFMCHARTIAFSHHEKWNGSGYPCGMYGEHIPLEGRLMAIADVYDAIISKRPYKDSMLPSKAAEIIMEGSGTHFDPALVNVFREVAPEFARTAWKYAAGESERWPGEVTRGLVCDVPPACATAIA